MRVDPTIDNYQVLILVHTRELMRQHQQAIEQMVKNTGITVSFAESKTNIKSHIVISTPGFIKNQVEARQKTMDLSNLKMVIFDELDEMFKNEDTQKIFNKLFNDVFTKIPKMPQFVLFSATVDEMTKKIVSHYIKDYKIIEGKKEQQKLDNVKQFKMKATE